MNNINEKFPKSSKKLQEFVKRNLIAFQKNIMKETKEKGEFEIPEITDEMAQRLTEGTLITRPRDLFDFFDEQEIFITIEWFQGNFIGHIVSTIYATKEYKERVEAEQELFEEAFKILEEKL